MAQILRKDRTALGADEPSPATGMIRADSTVTPQAGSMAEAGQITVTKWFLIKAGGPQTITLADGSTATLNGNDDSVEH